MPNLDGTGPNGKGPRTGRGMGNCPTDDQKPAPRGQGRGAGAGRRGQANRRGGNA